MRLTWALSLICLPVLSLSKALPVPAAPNLTPTRVSSSAARRPPSDSTIFEEKKALLLPLAAQNRAAQTLAIAQSFLGVPYVTGTLDRTSTEQLIVNLRELDCWTQVECSLALALTGAQGTYADFQDYLKKLRYWGGMVNGYGSRIHYFSGWVLQAEKLGWIQDVTRDLGGVPYRKRIGYITARPQKYPKISNPENLEALKNAELRINRHQWYFIPKAKVAAKEHLIQEGDIIILTSAKADLDISHQGFAVRRNGRIHLLHASSLAKKVIVSAQPLPQYLAKQRGQSGIMVARVRS